jgi:MATE family multidrug resistance protein
MICSEWWAFEIIGLLIAYLGNTQLASYSIIMSTASLFYTVPMGLSVAASNRIGNQLGNGKSNAARLTAYGSIILSLFFGLCNSAILTICRNVWPYLFTDDNLVASLVSKLLPIVALYQVI